MRMTKYMLKFGILTYRDGELKKKEMKSMFGYMCYLLDIFTHKKYLSGQSILEKIISKDSISDDYVKQNYLMTSFNDLKY